MSSYYTENGHFVSDDTIRTLRPNLRNLGEGVSRVVYALNDHEVLKLDTDRGPCGSNRTEVEFWDNLDEEDKPHFAAVIAHADDFSWIVSERIQTVADDAYGDDSDILNKWRITELSDLQNKYGFQDMHYGNFGIRTNGTCAVLDYAMNANRYDSDIEGQWCSVCETDTSHDAEHHGSYCDVCNDRHNTGQTKRHGAECDNCDSRQEDHSTFRKIRVNRTFRFNNGAKVRWAQSEIVCSWCANNARGKGPCGSFTIRTKSDIPRKKEIPGQWSLPGIGVGSVKFGF